VNQQSLPPIGQKSQQNREYLFKWQQLSDKDRSSSKSITFLKTGEMWVKN